MTTFIEKLRDLSKECTFIYLLSDNTIKTRQATSDDLGDRILRTTSVRILRVYKDGRVEVVKDRLGVYNHENNIASRTE